MSKHGHEDANEKVEEFLEDQNIPGAEKGPIKDPEEPGIKEDISPDMGWAEKYADLEAKFADMNDQYLRKAADFENYRKRMNRERQELLDFANQNLLLDLIPIIDDFERAIKSAENSKDFSSFYEGISMIEKSFSSQLEAKWGLKRFDSEGEPFDPNRHEAVQMEKVQGINEALVKEEFLKGYLLKERVIRYAKVTVLMPDAEQ